LFPENHILIKLEYVPRYLENENYVNDGTTNPVHDALNDLAYSNSVKGIFNFGVSAGIIKN